jgi:6-phosphogluconolactonase
MSSLEPFPTPDAAAEAAAAAIIGQLTPPGPKHIVVTGGRTPGHAYDQLAATDLDWSRVSITLSDERFVGPTADESNERLVRQRLLQTHAAAARFVPLKGAGPTAADDARAADPAVRALAPFDVVMLGMGDDGHIGSLFPSTPNVAALVSRDAEPAVVAVEVAGVAPFVPRISLTGRVLLDASLILVLISGDAKRAVVERVLSDPAYAPPVAAAIRQTRAPVRVLWSPAA